MISNKNVAFTKYNITSRHLALYTLAKLCTIDDFRGACAVKGNGAVAGHVKRVDHDDVFDALLFREETLKRHYFKLKFDFSCGIRPNMGKTEGIFLNLQCNCRIVGSIIIKTDHSPYNFSTWLPDLTALMPL